MLVASQFLLTWFQVRRVVVTTAM